MALGSGIHFRHCDVGTGELRQPGGELFHALDISALEPCLRDERRLHDDVVAGIFASKLGVSILSGTAPGFSRDRGTQL